MKFSKGLLAPFFLAFLIADLVVVVSACHSLNATLFNTEQLAVDGVSGSVHAFNLYYRTQPSSMSLEASRQQVYSFTTNFQRTVAVVDQLRLTVYTNSAPTNTAALSVALSSLGQQSSNITALVKFFMAQTPN
jgi:UDP-N-acetylmuramoylalanine-D-glutamate ligase